MNKRIIKRKRKELIKELNGKEKRVIYSKGSEERDEQEKIIEEILELRRDLRYHFPSDRKNLLKHDLTQLKAHLDKLRNRKKENNFYC